MKELLVIPGFHHTRTIEDDLSPISMTLFSQYQPSPFQSKTPQRHLYQVPRRRSLLSLPQYFCPAISRLAPIHRLQHRLEQNKRTTEAIPRAHHCRSCKRPLRVMSSYCQNLAMSVHSDPLSWRWLLYPDMQKRLRCVRETVSQDFTKVNRGGNYQSEHLEKQFCSRVIAGLSEIAVRGWSGESWKEMLSNRII